MIRRKLGSTNIVVSSLGLGLAALGRPGYINLGHGSDLGANYDPPVMERHAHAVLDRAWGCGVRYFDVARSYGRAEAWLGSWLRARSVAPRDVFVASKWGYTYTAGWRVEVKEHEVKEHTPGVLDRQWEESRATVGSFLRLYQIHSATRESGVLENKAVLNTLMRHKQTGILIGLSLSGVDQARTLYDAMEITIDGVRLFDCVQATWNVLERSCGPALASAHDAGIGVVVKEALANGRLTGRNDAPEFAGKRAVLDDVAMRLGTTRDAVAMAVVFAQPWVDVVLSGAATPDQLSSNARMCEVSLDPESMERIASLVETPEAYWRARASLPWN